MKEQLEFIMQNENLSANRFAAALGIQPSAISHILSGRNKPSYDMIVKLLTRFPAYNAEWLVLGQGTPFKSTATDIAIDESLPLITAINDDKDDIKEDIANEPSSVSTSDENVPPTGNQTTGLNDTTQNKNSANSGTLIVCFPDGTYSEYHSRN